MRLELIPKKTLVSATNIVQKLQENGFQAYWVGGVVRDMLMGRPCSEIDIATSATPDNICKIFEKVLLVGARFGVSVVVMDGLNFELTTFRKDADYIDGRHPQKVEFSSAREDASRRDFTINTLFYDPIEDRIIDFLCGEKDILQKTIRAVGEPVKRFEEDRLRILRAVRFHAQLGFEIDNETIDGIKRIKNPFRGLSMERIREEFDKILISSAPQKAIRLLDELSLLQKLLPEIFAMKNIPQPAEFHPEGDVFEHTMLGLDLASKKISDRDIILMWAILLHDVAKPVTIEYPKDKCDRIRFNSHDVEGEKLCRKILARFKHSNKVIESVAYVVRNHMRIGTAMKMRKGRLRMMIANEYFPWELNLQMIDCMSSHGELDVYNFLENEYKNFLKEKSLPQKIVTGKLLIKLGLKPSAMFSDIIDKCYEAQLEGAFSDQEQAIKYMRENFHILI